MSGVHPSFAVPDDYAHYRKRAVSQSPIATNATYLKYYHIAKHEELVLQSVGDTARLFAGERIATLSKDGDSGFVILHRCGADFYFLLLSIWHGANELWEAVYFTDPATDGFQAFPAAYPAADTALRPTFCVWELGVVAHEALSWQKFLSSPRDVAAHRAWQNDRYEGDV